MQEQLVKTIQIKKTENSKLSSLDFGNMEFGKIFSDHMFIMDYIDGKWQTPEIKPFENLSMHPATSVLHYGQSIFEGMKAYKNDKGEVYLFRPDQNVKRLNISAERMCMPQVPEDVLFDSIKTLIKLDHEWIPPFKGGSLYIRPLLFAIDDYIGVKPSNNYRLMIFTAPVGAYYSGEVKVKIEEHFTRAANGGTGYAKAAGNYAASLYPAKLAKEQGFDQLVWTDAAEHKYIEESGTMNIVFRSGNTVFTPASSDSILAGITRNSIIKLADHWGYKAEERKIEVSEIVDLLKKGELHEAFGAGTAATIARIKCIGYRDELFDLPNPKEWEFANRASETLEGIRRGEGENLFDWAYKLM